MHGICGMHIWSQGAARWRTRARSCGVIFEKPSFDDLVGAGTAVSPTEQEALCHL
jgi:hypothetical protein